MRFVVFLSILFLGFHAAIAQSVLEPLNHRNCDSLESEGLRTITVPLDHNQNNSGRLLGYNYQFIKNTAGVANATSLVYLTGGPGSGSIGSTEGNDFFARLLNIGVDLIMIDPRGVACNEIYYGEVPDSVITSEQTAMDIVEVIRHEKLDDYLILGHSYGTMLATILTSKINSVKDLSQPKLLVLEGTFGKHVETGSEYIENIIKVFREDMTKDFPAVKDIFFNNPSGKMPFGLPLSYWVGELGAYTSLGRLSFSRYSPKFVKFLSEYPASLMNKDLEAFFREEYESYRGFADVDSSISIEEVPIAIQFSYVYYSIVCKEISEEDLNNYDVGMIDGEIRAVKKGGADVCESFPFSERPYDPINYKLKTKTLYFQGTVDGQTPLSYFEHHYRSNSAEKVAVVVDGGGHSPFYTDLEMCTDQIWHQIKEGKTDFGAVLDQQGHCLRGDSGLTTDP